MGSQCNITQKNNTIKYCIDCNCELVIDINWAKYMQKSCSYICKSCNNKRKNDWRLANQDKVKIIYDRYINNHPEYDTNEWARKHPERAKEVHKQWRIAHPNYDTSKWRKSHPEEAKINHREDVRKSIAKRKRNLGWVKKFENPFTDTVKIDWHHINNEFVVAIPRELHKLYSGYKTDDHREGLLYIVNQIYLEGD